MWVVLIHIHDVCVHRLLVTIVTASRTGFRVMSRTSWGCVTLCCRLLVIMRSLRLVILVFEECLELHGGVTLCCRLLVIARSLRLVVLVFEECLELSRGVLLFVVGCWLLCDRYDWSYWFSTILVVPAFCTISASGFLAFVGLLGLCERKFFHFLTFWRFPFYLLFCLL